LLAAV